MFVQALTQFRLMPWLMWGFSTFFFAYQFIMRLAPGLVMPELMQKFSVTASDYGLFAAIYYFAYAGMQIPVALSLDRFGPRTVISLAALACSLGTLMLVYADNWNFALLGRFLIGAGSAAGFLGASKVVSLWFKEKHYSKMIGLTFSFGLLGAVYGGKPVGTLIALYGYEIVLAFVGYLGLFLSILLFAVLKTPTLSYFKPITHFDAVEEKVSLLSHFKSLLSNRKVLVLALANFLMVGSLEGFADVWGVPYLMTTRFLVKADAAQLISSIFVGMLFGGPILAYFSDKFRSYTGVTGICGLLMALCFAVLLLLNPYLSNTALYVLFFLTGILCCYQVLVFSIGVKLVPNELSGLTVAFLNCINMLGGSFFHSLIGYSMDFFWKGNMENGLKVYDSYTFTCALSSIALTAVMGGLLIFKLNSIKERDKTTAKFDNGVSNNSSEITDAEVADNMEKGEGYSEDSFQET